MKHVTVMGVAALAMYLAAAAAPAADLTLSDAERAELVGLLEDSRREFEELTARTTGDAWHRAPAEGRWSVGEIVEHLVLGEGGTLALIHGALQGEADPDWETVAATPIAGLVGMVRDRSQTFQAGVELQPKGEMSRGELLDEFARLRARTLDLARTTTAPVKSFTAQAPPGKLNVHQLLAVIAAHTQRHNAQIAQAQERLGGS